jgi:hypothetical protein
LSSWRMGKPCPWATRPSSSYTRPGRTGPRPCPPIWSRTGFSSVATSWAHISPTATFSLLTGAGCTSPPSATLRKS